MPETAPKIPYLTELLDRVEAMLDAGLATVSELGAIIAPGGANSSARVAEYVRKRDRVPNAEIGFALQDWAAAKTIEISKLPRAKQAGYRKAFREVRERHEKTSKTS